MLNLTISFIVSLLVTMLIVRVANRDGATADHDLDGIQKFHVRPVPRIGGLSIVAGCTVAVAALTSRDLPWPSISACCCCARPWYSASG